MQSVRARSSSHGGFCTWDYAVSLQPRSVTANLNFLAESVSVWGAVPRACTSLWSAGAMRQRALSTEGCHSGTVSEKALGTGLCVSRLTAPL